MGRRGVRSPPARRREGLMAGRRANGAQCCPNHTKTYSTWSSGTLLRRLDERTAGSSLLLAQPEYLCDECVDLLLIRQQHVCSLRRHERRRMAADDGRGADTLTGDAVRGQLRRDNRSPPHSRATTVPYASI